MKILLQLLLPTELKILHIFSHVTNAHQALCSSAFSNVKRTDLVSIGWQMTVFFSTLT